MKIFTYTYRPKLQRGLAIVVADSWEEADALMISNPEIGDKIWLNADDPDAWRKSWQRSSEYDPKNLSKGVLEHNSHDG